WSCASGCTIVPAGSVPTGFPSGAASSGVALAADIAPGGTAASLLPCAAAGGDAAFCAAAGVLGAGGGFDCTTFTASTEAGIHTLRITRDHFPDFESVRTPTRERSSAT